MLQGYEGCTILLHGWLQGIVAMVEGCNTFLHRLQGIVARVEGYKTLLQGLQHVCIRRYDPYPWICDLWEICALYIRGYGFSHGFICGYKVCIRGLSVHLPTCCSKSSDWNMSR